VGSLGGASVSTVLVPGHDHDHDHDHDSTRSTFPSIHHTAAAAAAQHMQHHQRLPFSAHAPAPETTADTMASQHSQKAPGLPNPYAQKGLPNPYAQATVASAAPVRYTEEQAKAEQQKKAPGIYLLCSSP
jgi:hypothetical protein